jgi:hypothetical protein
MRIFVAIELIENAVKSVMRFAINRITRVLFKPVFPTTHPILRYMITPNMVRILGTNTPPNVPNPFALLIINE